MRLTDSGAGCDAVISDRSNKRVRLAYLRKSSVEKNSIVLGVGMYTGDSMSLPRWRHRYRTVAAARVDFMRVHTDTT